MPMFTLVIDKAGPGFGGGNPRGVRQQLLLVLGKVLEQIGDGVSTKGDIVDPNDPVTVIGNWMVEQPEITGLVPATCAIGGPDFTLIVQGTAFSTNSIIHFAGHDEPTTYNDVDGSLSTGVKPSLWGAPATVQCSVRNGMAESNALDFVFSA